MRQQLTATWTALLRNRAARNRHQAVKVQRDMRARQVERRKRTRHLIELGGLIVKVRIVELTEDDRATILGGLLWKADELQSDKGREARELWAARGKHALEMGSAVKWRDLQLDIGDVVRQRCGAKSRIGGSSAAPLRA